MQCARLAAETFDLQCEFILGLKPLRETHEMGTGKKDSQLEQYFW